MSRAFVLVCEDFKTDPMKRRTARAALRKIQRDQRRLPGFREGLCQGDHQIVMVANHIKFA